MTKPHVAILGLGIMGGGMAGRLLSAGFPLTVYNRTREKTLPLSNAGALVADTPRGASSRAEIVIAMVADDSASRQVWLGEHGALAGVQRGCVLMECSTLSVAWIRELAAASARSGCEFLDAPVTGTKPHAAAGELLFLVGGPADTLEKVRPILSVLGRNTIHFGPLGSGAIMKLVNNFLCGVQAASFAEALSLIDAAGMDRTKAVSVLTDGAPGSGIVKRVAASLGADDFDPNFLLRWMAKDLKYAMNEASAKGATLETAVPALHIFERAVARGHGSEDFSAVTKAFPQN